MARRPILQTRWNALLGDFRRSGLTHAEFCRRRGLSIHSFRKHLYARPATKPGPPQVTPAATPPTPAPPQLPAAAPVVTPFRPVTIPPEPQPGGPRSPHRLELILSQRHRI